ncbi:MAG: response regulator [Candidatus Omnitrophica bacterium]|nr:response regulator [Candidatus Omnitrophota bacterium]
MTDTQTGIKKILIVEDEEDMRSIYEMIFSEYKDEYNVDIVDNAEVAKIKAKTNDYDVIILDIIMYPMPGDFLFFFLRQDKKTKETPVIVVSVLAPNTPSFAGMKAINHVDFLEKPIKAEQLIEKIKQVL